LLQKYNVSYIVIGPSEMEGWHADRKKFATYFQPVFQSETTTIYEVPWRNAPSAPPHPALSPQGGRGHN
jgi:uncharacterized membrane protein